jgi:hypothetical protein
VDAKSQTSKEGIFAAGDVVTGTKSVIAAISEARRSAEEIDRYLGGDGDISEQLIEAETPSPYFGQCRGFADLERKQPELLDADIRKKSFVLVEQPFSEEVAKCEASRCLQCDQRMRLTRPKLWNEYGGEEQ